MQVETRLRLTQVRMRHHFEAASDMAAMKCAELGHVAPDYFSKYTQDFETFC